MDVDIIDCGLHPRFWLLNGDPSAAARHIALIGDGTAEAEVGSRRIAIAGPSLAWIGGHAPSRLRVHAGATGFRARIQDAVLVDAIGDDAESVALRYLVDRDFVLSLAWHADAARALERCLGALAEERRAPGEASGLLVSALLRIILVQILRVAAGGETGMPGAGERLGLLRRFRQLVEMNFRNHWPVARYAEALGISADRLHAICTSGIGKPPKALISERLAHEAMLRLERSSLTIHQLGHSLGFADAAHFSNFFRRMTGQPPGRYRSRVVEARGARRQIATPSFAEWP